MITEDRRGRPAWLDSIGNVVFLVGATAMWAYFMVRALSKGAYALGALDGLLVIVSVWTITRILRRRRRLNSGNESGGRDPGSP